MKNKDLAFILLLLAAVCAGCFIVSAWQARTQTAAAFLILAAALAAAGIISHYSGDSEESGVAQPTTTTYAPQYVERARTYEEDQASSGPGLGVQVSALAARGLESAGKAAGQGVTKFLERPPFWTGVGFALLAIVSFFAGMTGMATTWKAMHAAGLFALVSAGFFASAYQQWATGKEFAAKHFAVIWLVLSVLGLLVTWLHQNWPTGTMAIAFILSGIAAAITLIGKWKEVGEFLGTWLFTKGKASLFIWLLILMLCLLMSFSPAILAGKAVTSATAALGTLFAAGFWLLIPIGIWVIWKKL